MEHQLLDVYKRQNEYSGDCHCELCQENFRDWLKNKYKTIELSLIHIYLSFKFSIAFFADLYPLSTEKFGSIKILSSLKYPIFCI